MFIRRMENREIRRRKQQFMAFLLTLLVTLSSLAPALVMAASVDLTNEKRGTSGVHAEIDHHKILLPGDTIYYSYSDNPQTDETLTKIEYYNGAGAKIKEDTAPDASGKRQVLDYDTAFANEDPALKVPLKNDFLGWQIKFNQTATYTEVYGGDSGNVKVLKLYAIPKAGTYKVEFDPMGALDDNGSPLTIDSQIIADNSNPQTRLVAPDIKWKDHEFLGWYKDPDYNQLYGGFNYNNKYNFDNEAPLGQDTTLYAKWSYPVRYYLNKNGVGKGTAEAPEAPYGYGGKVGYGSRIVNIITTTLGGNTQCDNPPKFDAEDSHDFVGWFDKNGNQYHFDQSDPVVTEDLDLFAHWKYNVTYDAKGGTPEPPKQTVEEGAYIDEPTEPTFGERIFKGWYDDNILYNRYLFRNAPNGITKDLHLTAKWDCTVIFDAGDGTFLNENDDPQKTESFATMGTAIQPENIPDPDTKGPAKEGSTFAYWHEKGSTEPFDMDSVINDNITLYAEYTLNTYKVKYSANGGSGTMADQDRTYDDGLSLSPNAFTREGYTFEKWTTSADGSGTSYEDKYKGNLTSKNGETITLYAKWKNNDPDKCTVKFDTAGGTAIADQTVDKGTTANKPNDPVKDGYKFLGWYKDAAGTTAYNFAEAVNSDITIYAKWEADTSSNENGNENGSPSENKVNNGFKFVPFDTTGKLLQVAIIKRTDDSMTISWNKIDGADGYLIFGHMCYSKHVRFIKDITDIANRDTFIYEQTGLRKGRYYKYQIKAYKKVGKKKKIIAKSLRVHGVTTSDKYTVADKVNIENVAGGEFSTVSGNNTLKLGTKNKSRITSKEILEEPNKTIQHSHRPEKQLVTWQSNDTKVAVVSRSGKIKAKGPGECTIYGTAQNGMLMPVKVVVQ